VRWQGEELVKVRSESELRAGMTVVVSPCKWCSRTHAHVLVRESPIGECHHYGDGVHYDHQGWVVAHGTCNRRECLCPRSAIRDGRMFRLRDLDDSTEQTRERERERVE
jgi:hypothetical protein